MRICAAIIYYRVTPSIIYQAITSLYNEPAITNAVLVDGPFHGRSTDISQLREEREAIQQAYDDTPTLLDYYTTNSRVYDGEAQKRTLAARLAWELYGGGQHAVSRQLRPCDWLLVIDADETLDTPITEPPTAGRGVALIIDPHKPRGAATMIRLHPLSPDLAWGPYHIEVMSRGMRYSTPHCLPDRPHHFQLTHHEEPLKLDPAYQHYNREIRPWVEAGMGDPSAEYVIPSADYQSRADTVYTSFRDPAVSLTLPRADTMDTVDGVTQGARSHSGGDGRQPVGSQVAPPP